ncbi:MAG: leucine-rich repeat protein [Bacteroidaceae bacterium]|nr:leucine-rich repeat protein [Bacteroidaceae bacterium]
MKKLYFKPLFTALLLLCNTLISAQDFEADGIFYNITDATAKTVEVTDCPSGYEYSNAVSIPSTVTHNGTTYSVTSIGNFAFAYCTAVTSVTIPGSVTTIRGYAFQDCTALTNITIPGSVTTIESSVFYNCNALKEMRIADSENSLSINSNNFFQTLPIETLYLGRNLTHYYYYYNSNNTNLKSVTIGDKVTNINNYLFTYCDSLKTITIGNSVESIGEKAFQYCDLREIHLPASVTSIGDYAFTWNRNLQKITMDSGNKVYNIPADSNIIMKGDSVIFGWQGAVIPENATYIGNGAFNSVKGITSITIPANVWRIGEWAFEACSDLTEIHCLGETPVNLYTANTFQGLYDSVTLYVPAAGKKLYTTSNIWKDFTNIVTVGEIVVNNFAFAIISEEDRTVQVTDYTGSGSVANIPSSITYNGKTYKVTTIRRNAFKDYTNISGITIPGSITTIEYSAFQGCTALTSITIPKSVTTIKYNALSGCTALTSIKVEDGNPIYDSREDCNAIIETATNTLMQGCQNSIIPNSINTISDFAFDGCTGLTSIEIPNSVTTIGSSAFAGCTRLSIITIPNSVTTIYYYAFEGCTNLRTVVNNSSLDIVAGTTTNGYVAYYADEVIANNGGSTIDNFIFDNKGNLVTYIGPENEITLPQKNQFGKSYIINNAAFIGDTALTSVTIGNGVTAIGDAAFSGCTSLTSTTIGKGVTDIGNAAFQGCAALKEIYVQGTTPALLDSEAFTEHYTSATLYVPIGTKAAYQSSTSKREEEEVKFTTTHCNNLADIMKSKNKNALYETISVGTQNPDVAGTLYGGDYLLAHQASKTKMTELPRATFGITGTRSGQYKIALVTPPWFIESYSDTLIKSTALPQYNDSYLRVRVSQNNEQLAMLPCDSFNIGTSNTKFGVWEEHAIVPDRSRIDTIFLKDSSGEDYIFDLQHSGYTLDERNNCTVDVNIELLRPLQYSEKTGRYTSKNANLFAFRFLLDQIMLIPVDESTTISTTYWRNFTNIVEYSAGSDGDINGDGSVDVSDLTTLVSIILDSSKVTDVADINGDGSVDVSDLTTLVSIILGTNSANAAPTQFLW